MGESGFLSTLLPQKHSLTQELVSRYFIHGVTSGNGRERHESMKEGRKAHVSQVGHRPLCRGVRPRPRRQLRPTVLRGSPLTPPAVGFLSTETEMLFEQPWQGTESRHPAFQAVCSFTKGTCHRGSPPRQRQTLLEAKQL